MEPNKIDTKIKEKLVSREIKPSAQAWDRLDAMLSVVEQKKEKKVFWSFRNIGIAASFLLFCTLGFWLYNQNNTDEIIIDENNVVIKENNIENKKDTLKVDKPVINQEKFISKPAEAIVDNSKKTEAKKESTSMSNKVNNHNQINKELNTIAENNVKQVVANERDEVGTTTNKYITGEMILAAVENRPIEKKELSTKDVHSKVRVNTSSLLSSVETELDENHKETTIDKLTRNFKQVKSALANRNYEE